MTTAKSIVDSVTRSEGSTRRRTSKGYNWHNAAGEYHRDDGPARVWKDGSKEWWVNGKLHRLDGPAVEWANGEKQWWVNGKLHRTDGPATESATGTLMWWVNGKLHRTDGPAWVYDNGDSMWYINGRQFTEDEFNRYVDQTTGEVLVPPGKKLTHDKK